MMEPKTLDGYKPNQYDDPSANLWSTYLSKSEKDDKIMAQNWKGDMDAILIFAGLFSASVTAFIVESYKTLNPDPNNASVILLAQISRQLATMSLNSSRIADASALNLGNFDQSNFSASPSSLVCNALWFLSLGFSLICALSATLVEQWTRQYIQAATSKPAPQDRARMGAYLFQGIKKYRMAAIVEVIPMLLHISLFLFFAGLVAFLVPLNSGLEYLILAILICCCSLYFLVTILPVFDLSCPYWTPLSGHFWALFRKLRLLHRQDADGNDVPVLPRMSEAREIDAIEITSERDERDLKAICWTINAQREDHEFEPFVEAIPSVVSGFDYSAKWLMNTLLDHQDMSIKLGSRIPRLLATCTTGTIDTTVAHRRAITCIKSIWSLTMLAFPRPVKPTQYSFRSSLRFKEDMFDLLSNIQKVIPSVTDHVLSTSVVIARSMLDMHMDRMLAYEEDLLNFLGTGRFPRSHKLDPEIFYATMSERDMLIATTKARMHELESTVSQTTIFTVPLVYVMLEAFALHYRRIISLAAIGECGAVDKKIIHETLHSIQSFQDILNQAGLHLTLEYISKILESETLPHEAFNTLRRIFFRINFKPLTKTITPDGQISLNHSKMIFTKQSQDRLVVCLEEAVESTKSESTRLPETIVNIILNLTQALSDSTAILKAIHVIKNYSKVAPNDSALRALQILEQNLPGDFRNYRPLDLFSSHVYANAKPDRQPSKTMSRSSALASS